MIIVYILAAIGFVTVLGVAGLLILIAIASPKMVMEDPYDRRAADTEKEEEGQ